MDGGAWWAAIHGVAKSRTRLSDFTFTFHFHALEKEMATHSSVLAWRIPGKGEPDGLPSQGSHRVGHDWSDLAAVAASHHCETESPLNWVPLSNSQLTSLSKMLFSFLSQLCYPHNGEISKKRRNWNWAGPWGALLSTKAPLCPLFLVYRKRL